MDTVWTRQQLARLWAMGRGDDDPFVKAVKAARDDTGKGFRFAQWEEPLDNASMRTTWAKT